MKKETSELLKAPNLPRRLFWEYRYETIHWTKHIRMVIERVLEWGRDSEVEELIRFYGFDTVKSFLLDKPMYLMEHSLNRACKRLGVTKEETMVWKRKVERGFGWI